nr:immunoglobulin heavy chain junction region [Mus musculus]
CARRPYGSGYYFDYW